MSTSRTPDQTTSYLELQEDLLERIWWAREDGKVLTSDAVSYTHLTLPTTPYV